MDEPANNEPVDLSKLSESELRARHADLTAQIEALRESGDLTVSLASQINELKIERNMAVDAINLIHGLDAAVETGDLPEVLAPEVETTETVETVDPVTDPESGEVAEVLAAAENIVANADVPDLAVTAGARPVAPTVQSAPRVAYVAGAGQRAFAQGMELDMAGLARAWDSRRDIRPSANGGVEQAIIASLPGFDTTEGLAMELLSTENGTVHNDRLIAESVEAWRAKRNGEQITARTAAICTPLDIIREVPECGETDTPFTNLFPQRPVGRLGFTFTRASTAASTNGAINEWGSDDQDAIDEGDPATWKPCIPIECATPATVTAEELVTCVTVDTSTEMSSPERVADFMHKLAVQRARRREQIQLTRFDATASGFTLDTTATGFGTLPSLVQAVETMMPTLAYPERLDETDWDIVLEPGLVQKLTIDRHKVENPVEVAAARSETLAWLTAYLGRRVVELRDYKGANPLQTIPAAGASATQSALPNADRIRFVPAGAYISGSTGEESTGWQTDPQLARQNRRQAFSTEWYLLAKHGCHPAAYVDLTSAANGGRGGVIYPVA